MSDEERDLLNSLLTFLGDPVVETIGDVNFSEIGPTDPLFESLCEQHGTDPSEIRLLLTPPPGKNYRPLAIPLAAALLGKLRREEMA